MVLAHPNLENVFVQDQTLKEALGTSLNIQSPKKLNEVAENVFSSLLLYGIKHGDESVIQRLLGQDLAIIITKLFGVS